MTSVLEMELTWMMLVLYLEVYMRASPFRIIPLPLDPLPSILHYSLFRALFDSSHASEKLSCGFLCFNFPSGFLYPYLPSTL